MKIQLKSTFQIVVFLSALNGMLSEFLLGHLMALNWGSVYKQYAMTMGFFMAAMGFGAWIFRNEPRPAPWLQKILLISAACLCLSLALTWWIVDEGPDVAVWLLQGLLILWIGFCAGAELPLLQKMKDLFEDAPDASSISLLFWDYLGMFFGSLLFGFYLLQTVGVFGTFVLVIFLHLSLCLWATYAKSRVGGRRKIPI